MRDEWERNAWILAAVWALVLLLACILPACAMGPSHPEEKAQVEKSSEKVTDRTDTRAEAGDKSEIINKVDKRLTSFQKTLQKQIEANNSARSKMQDKLGHIVKGVEKVEQHTKTITKNFGISQERQNLERTRLRLSYEMMFSIAGAIIGLLVAGWFAPAPNMNRAFMLGGISAGLLITVASIANVFWG